MTFIKRESALAVCLSHFSLQIVSEGGVTGVCVCVCVFSCVAGGNNLIAELNLYLVRLKSHPTLCRQSHGAV